MTATAIAARGPEMGAAIYIRCLSVDWQIRQTTAKLEWFQVVVFIPSQKALGKCLGAI